ncbi:MAG TPA: ABC transporter permease, partial [Spirochaetia bacterium]|nr:ABC transporter permease [Spirochaetia bacterium]
MRLLLFSLRRLGRLLLTVLLISTIVFFVIRVIPGDPALVIAGVDASPDAVAAIRVRIGTDKPLAVQYGTWLLDVASLRFGTSLATGQPVAALVFQRFPLTLSLAMLGLLLSVAIAVPLGIASAVRRWSGWDYLG